MGIAPELEETMAPDEVAEAYVDENNELHLVVLVGPEQRRPHGTRSWRFLGHINLPVVVGWRPVVETADPTAVL